MYVLTPNEYTETDDKIQVIIEKQAMIKEETTKLKEELQKAEVEEHLLRQKLNSPILVPTDEKIGKYRFLSEQLSLPELGITLCPVWLSTECTYPCWSKDFMSLNIVNYEDFDIGKGYEILIEGISKGLRSSYSDSIQMITDHKLYIPNTYHFNYVLDSNIRIDFSTGIPIKYHQHRNKKYHLSCSDDENMLLNTVKIKYILVLPYNYSSQIDFFCTDYLEYL